LIEALSSRGLQMDKRIEVDSPEEITADFLVSELHPVKSLNRPKFAKPAPPGRAGGARRLVGARQTVNNSSS